MRRTNDLSGPDPDTCGSEGKEPVSYPVAPNLVSDSGRERALVQRIFSFVVTMGFSLH